MTNLNGLGQNFSQWLVWQSEGAGRCGALHRRTGIVVDSPKPDSLAEVMAELEGLLGGDGEGAGLRNGVR